MLGYFPKLFAAMLLTSITAMPAALVAGNGNQVRNGGKAVVCLEESGARNVTFIDVYMVNNRLDKKFHAEFPGEHYLEKVRNVFAMIAELDPPRSTRYLRDLDHLMKNLEFVDYLESVDDELVLNLSKRCRLEQAAIQTSTSDDVSYQVNHSLWNEMDDESRAGLILHEIIYRDIIIRGGFSSTLIPQFFFFLKEKPTETTDFMNLTLALNIASIDFYRNNKKWTWLAGRRVNFERADRACRLIAGSRLPNPEELYELGDLRLDEIFPSQVIETYRPHDYLMERLKWWEKPLWARKDGKAVEFIPAFQMHASAAQHATEYLDIVCVEN